MRLIHRFRYLVSQTLSYLKFPIIKPHIDSTEVENRCELESGCFVSR